MKVKNIIRGAIIGIPITITVLDCFGYIAKVDGISMQPSLNPVEQRSKNDFVFLNRWSVRKFDVRRGDIVSLVSPRDPDQKIIKRVIGLEGDTIKSLGYKQQYVKVPVGHCWVEGDHHSHSMDSNIFGPVAVGLITAKATHIVWPPERWQRLEHKLPQDRSPATVKKLFEEQDQFDSGLHVNSREESDIL